MHLCKFFLCITILSLLSDTRVFGNSPEILVGPMPVSLRKSRTTPVCSSPSPLGRFARPLHEHDATVHPPSINIRSQVISTGNVLASPLNDTISVFGKQSGLAFVRLPSVPDMINAFNSSSNAVSQQVSSAYQALCKEWDVPQDYRPKEVNPTGARLTRAHGTAH
uniref:Uncharacterized protein n=1 Tax=Cryptomonas curvata TaxID=233186 RepID=A0A7S0MPP0_9CRYP|mmetsp:Transcript_48738/g.101748  ORF Transcript_48738/g.101748 Transcript_48738/m.101748 type:complete len:165 (+) Transcript_48738:125-619(+)